MAQTTDKTLYRVLPAVRVEIVCSVGGEGCSAGGGGVKSQLHYSGEVREGD